MRSGVTLVELVLVIGLFTLLATVGLLSLITPQQKLTADSAKNLILLTVKEAQNKAMTGVEAENFSVHFESGGFSLFKGTIFDSTDPENLVTNLDPSLSFTAINLPSQNIVFSKLSGEAENFDPALNSIILTDSQTGKNFTFTLNRLGAVNVN